MWKETVDKDILENCAIYQNNELTSLENKEVDPVQPVQMNMLYQ